MPENVFADDWRECLQAHYMHVIRLKDKVTEPSLTVVMRDAGFNESELAELRVRATAHVDEIGADFVPDLNILNTLAPAAPPSDEPRVFPVAVDLAPVEDTFVALTDDDLLVGEDEPEEADVEPEHIDEMVAEALPEDDEPDEDEPQQLSLF
jgi:hypothetical protein